MVRRIQNVTSTYLQWSAAFARVTTDHENEIVGIKLSEKQLTTLRDVVQERSKDRNDMKTEEFEALLSTYGFISEPSTKHVAIRFKDGSEVIYELRREGRVSASFNGHG